MLRKIVLATTAAMLAVGGVAVMADTAGAAKPTITATGDVSCAIGGKVKIDPPLRNTNTAPSTVTGKLKGTCTGTTQQGVTPTKVKMALTYAGSGPGTCNGLAEPTEDPFTINLTWKGDGGKINPSTATLKGFVISGVPNFGFDLPNPNAASPQSTVSGSYAGTNNSSAHAHIDVPDTSVCEPTTKPNGQVKAAKGIKKIVIKNPGSSFTINN
jgi:hypothetical protein